LTVRGAFSYAYLQYEDYPAAQCNPIQLLNPLPLPTSGPLAKATCYIHPVHLADGTTHNTFSQDQSGLPYGDGPLQISLGFTYDKPISDKWSMMLTFDAQATSSGYDILG